MNSVAAARPVPDIEAANMAWHVKARNSEEAESAVILSRKWSIGVSNVRRGVQCLLELQLVGALKELVEQVQVSLMGQLFGGACSQACLDIRIWMVYMQGKSVNTAIPCSPCAAVVASFMHVLVLA